MKKYIYTTIFLLSLFLFAGKASAYYDCSQYGLWAYSDGLGHCKCMSGYVWGSDILGNRSCVSCFNKYGLHSTYDYLSDSCKCMSGYVWGTNFLGDPYCVSGDSACQDDYGYGSEYDSLTGKCKCKRGYEFTRKKYSSGLECVRCSEKYGIHSSYNSLTKKCECDDGYTLKDGECKKRHNSAYFLLKEVNTDNREAIVKSHYTGTCYHIEYGISCLSSTIHRYIDDDVVINMGTDFYIDVWDWLVLHDDDQECYITNVDTVSCSLTLEESDQSYGSTYNYLLLRQLLNNSSCGENSYLTNDNKCKCNDGYQWVSYEDPDNFDCELVQVLGSNLNQIKNFIKEEKSKLGNIDTNLTNRLKGKILLQVENRGQAWYVNPKDGKRYYMANGNEAYRIMRDLGVGITNEDLNKVKNDKNFAKKHSGKIFLQVKDLGQAWYVNFDGNAHYLKDGFAAYNIMRDLGLGITNNDLRKIDIEI